MATKAGGREERYFIRVSKKIRNAREPVIPLFV
jgi:hypothetical protein